MLEPCLGSCYCFHIRGALRARGLGPGGGGRCWRPPVAIRWGSYFREWVLLGCFFLGWSVRGKCSPSFLLERTVATSILGSKWERMVRDDSTFSVETCQLSCLLRSTLVLNWTWCPRPRHTSVTLSHRKHPQLLAVLWRGSPHYTESRR